MHSSQRLGAILLIGGVLAGSAALFGPDERVWGVDVGATGALLFAVVLGGAIWLFSVRGATVFPEEMSVAERRAWIGLVFVGFVLFVLARHLWMLWEHELVPRSPHDFFGRQFVQQLIVPLIVWGILSHLIGRAAGGVEEDERDLRLRRRADRAGDWTLTLIVIACISVLASVPAIHLEWWLAPIVLANVLIGLLIAKSLVEHIVLAAAYRFARA
jgi:hypothetical protein